MKTGLIGETIEIIQEEVEKGGQTAKQQITAKQSQQTGQVQSTNQSGQDPTQLPSSDQNIGMPSEQVTTGKAQADPVKKFVQDLYGGTTTQITEAEIAQKELEDKKKHEELRQKLHGEYYQQLVNPPKPKEPHAQEKLEQEKQEELVKLEEEEKGKPKPLPIVATKGMGTGEKHRGVSG